MPNDDPTQTTVDEILNVDEGDSEDESDIFEKPWLLEIDNVPGANRIVGRDDHITFLVKNLRKMRRYLSGVPPAASVARGTSAVALC